MRLQRGGFELEYEDAGSGPAILFAHSMTSNLRMWDPQAEALAGRYRVVRWDNRGHGKSDSPPGPYSLEAFAEDACALLDARGIERVHFIGLSVGGMIAQAFALKYAQRLMSLTLVDSAGKYPPETVGKWTERAALVRREGNGAGRAKRGNECFPAGIRGAFAGSRRAAYGSDAPGKSRGLRARVRGGAGS